MELLDFNILAAQDFIKKSDFVVTEKCEKSKRLSDRAIYEAIRQDLRFLAIGVFQNHAIEVFSSAAELWDLLMMTQTWMCLLRSAEIIIQILPT